MSAKILLADASDVMRTAIARLLKEEPGIELVGEASYLLPVAGPLAVNFAPHRMAFGSSIPIA